MCVLVCQPAVVDRGPCRDLPCKLLCDQDCQGKLYTQAPREEDSSRVKHNTAGDLKQHEAWDMYVLADDA